MIFYILAQSPDEVETEVRQYDTADEARRLRAQYPALRGTVIVKVTTELEPDPE